MNGSYRIEVDLLTCGKTWGEVMAFILAEKAAHPDREYYHDMSEHAIVSSRREDSA